MYQRFQYQPAAAVPTGWDAYAEDYAKLLSPDTIYSLTKELIHRHVIDHLDADRPVHVLDLNCGVGNDFPFFLARGWNVTACDGSVGMLNKAHEKYRAEIDAGRITLFLGQMESLDGSSFPESAFDLIFSVTGGFSYISDDEVRAVGETLGGYLAPDGVMIIAHLNKVCPSDMVYQLLHARLRQALIRLRNKLNIQIKGQTYRMFLRGPTKVRRLTPPNLRTEAVLPLLWLTPPYQTGCKPGRQVLRLLRAIEMRTRGVSLLSLIADQVVAILRRRTEPRPASVASPPGS